VDQTVEYRYKSGEVCRVHSVLTFAWS
jgi:hypothetical protein